MANFDEGNANILSIETLGKSETKTTRDLAVFLDGKRVGGVLSIKLGAAAGDGTLRVNELVTATIEVSVTLG